MQHGQTGRIDAVIVGDQNTHREGPFVGLLIRPAFGVSQGLAARESSFDAVVPLNLPPRWLSHLCPEWLMT
jgi:hypothetical protein